MDATAELTGKPASNDYTIRPGALIWFFHKSRDRWKKKHQDLKATVNGFKNQIAAVTKNREQWRLKAEQASQRLRNWKPKQPLCRRKSRSKKKRNSRAVF